MKNPLPFPRQSLSWSARFRAAGSSRWLPLALLLLTLSAMFLFANDRGAFYRPGHHNFLSAQSMTLAANLSPAHNFLMYLTEIPEPDSTVSYHSYNRFPIGTYALIKLAILPFGADLSAQIYAARLLMLSFVAATAVLAYLSLCRIGGDRWLALGATALAFASSYCLYYNDMVSTEITSLFGIMLVFHGIVLFTQEGRFRQLAVKSCIALLLGWHIYALLLPFIVLGLAQEIVKARRAAGQNSNRRQRRIARAQRGAERAAGWLKDWLRAAWPGLRAFLTGHHFRLGVIALACGLLLLGFNLFNEYRAYAGNFPLTELPTVDSMLYRSGLDTDWQFYQYIGWPEVFRTQFVSVGIMAAPFALPGYTIIGSPDGGGDRGLGLLETQLLYMGIGVFAATWASLWFFAGHRLMLAALLLAGWCWALPFRGSSLIHDFEALFFIGIPLVLFLTLLRFLGRGDRRISGALAVAALLVFVFASFQASQIGLDEGAAEFQSEIVADFEVIRELTAGQSVILAAREAYTNFVARQSPEVFFYLAGRPILENPYDSRSSSISYLIQPYRAGGGGRLSADPG